jgi:hypothetical protein
MFANLLTNYATPHLNDCNANSQDIKILWAENDLFQEGKCYTNNEFQQIAEKIHKQENKFSYCKICFEYKGTTFGAEIYKNKLPSVEYLINTCEQIININL